MVRIISLRTFIIPARFPQRTKNAVRDKGHVGLGFIGVVEEEIFRDVNPVDPGGVGVSGAV